MDAMTCCICFGQESNTTRCASGHCVCLVCDARTDGLCPMCKAVMMPRRDILLGKLVDACHVRLQCSACSKRVLVSDHEKHRKWCRVVHRVPRRRMRRQYPSRRGPHVASAHRRTGRAVERSAFPVVELNRMPYECFVSLGTITSGGIALCIPDEKAVVVLRWRPVSDIVERSSRSARSVVHPAGLCVYSSCHYHGPTSRAMRASVTSCFKDGQPFGTTHVRVLRPVHATAPTHKLPDCILPPVFTTAGSGQFVTTVVENAGMDAVPSIVGMIERRTPTAPADVSSHAPPISSSLPDFRIGIVSEGIVYLHVRVSPCHALPCISVIC